MPAIALLFWGTLSSVLASLIGRAILALGVGAVAYVGFDVLISKVDTYVNGKLNGLMVDLYNAAAYFGIVAAIKMHLATFAAMATLAAGKASLKMMQK